MSLFGKRQAKLRKWLADRELDAFLVTNPVNVRYLFGFAGEGMGVIGRRSLLSTDRRFEFEAAALPESPKFKLHPRGHLAGAIEHLASLKASRVGIEADHLTVGQYEKLLADLGDIQAVSTQKAIEDLRIIKDDTEVECIRQAARIMDRVLTRVVKGLREGVTERDVTRALEAGIEASSAEGMGFDTIVAFGPHAAQCHAVPGKRKLKPGQMVKIDCGAMVQGYRSDITRTWFFGEPTPRFRKVYGAVYRAQVAAVAAVRPGVTGAELDAVARDLLAAEGFGEQFSHGLGHGVGLNIHEAPGLSSRSEDVMQPGMVITVEPGVYIEGWGGVRIEDTVLVTADGCESLTRTPKLKLK